MAGRNQLENRFYSRHIGRGADGQSHQIRLAFIGMQVRDLPTSPRTPRP